MTAEFPRPEAEEVMHPGIPFHAVFEDIPLPGAHAHGLESQAEPGFIFTAGEGSGFSAGR